MDDRVGNRSWLLAAFAVFAVGWGANQFAPLLYHYRTDQGLAQSEVTAMFSIYIVGLIPTLLLAGRWSDRNGRRVLMRPVLVLSLAATVLMLFGVQNPFWLYLGRFLAGLASGAAFGAGSAWVRELSAGSPPGTGARRAAIALSGGFGLGGMVAGLVGEFVPAPLLSAYVPHLVLGTVALVVAWNTADPYQPVEQSVKTPLIPASAGTRRFLLGVAPWAWLVFGCASMSFAVLADLLGGDAGGLPTAYAGVMVGVTLGSGVLIQPVIRRIAADTPPSRPPIIGLGAASIGMAAGAILAAATDLPGRALWLLPVAVMLGIGYGTLLVAGMVQVELQSGVGDHAGLVAVFYVIAYLGMGTPYVLAELSRFGGPVPWIAGLAVVCALLIPLARRQLR
ncbi:major facilitator family transporter [Dietzia sp. NCCP-2495]|uniref:MFS transporter n=1 Tax=Dietzia sp. NCCP-2495 TaxID=2934675 RepID=UPI00222F7B7A|nr:MFS transporter [Dietzia sp. NCCP-2495]GLB65172.1 major facilitator family transporter [Dietzia sp. NCCP-2495]